MKDHSQYGEALALYAIGALDDREECSELEVHLRSCAECRSELAALRGDAALLALSAVGPAPPQAARQRLMAAISPRQGGIFDSESRKRGASQRVVIGVLRPGWLRYAPVAAALLLAVFSLLLWRTNSRLLTRLERTQAELEKEKTDRSQFESLAKVLHDPDTMQITLVAVKKPPQPHVKTFYSPKMGRLILVASNLEPLPPKMAYELWLLPAGGGAPMPCGMFNPNAKGDAMMDHSLASAGIEAKGFAITVEPATGSSAPTAPIQFSGTG